MRDEGKAPIKNAFYMHRNIGAWRKQGKKRGKNQSERKYSPGPQEFLGSEMKAQVSYLSVG